MVPTGSATVCYGETLRFASSTLNITATPGSAVVDIESRSSGIQSNIQFNSIDAAYFATNSVGSQRRNISAVGFGHER